MTFRSGVGPRTGYTLIIDSEDEAHLGGLSEDERIAVMEQRLNATRTFAVGEGTVPSSSTGNASRLKSSRNVRFELPPDPESERGSLVPFHECRSLEAAWMALFGFTDSRNAKGARHLLDAQSMREWSGRDYARMAEAALRFRR